MKIASVQLCNGCDHTDSFQLRIAHMLNDLIDFHNALGDIHFDHTELTEH